jgi:PAS domain S-box-containing protein
LHKEGHPIVLETSGAPIIDAAGNVSGYRGADRDITEHVQAEKDLLESKRKYRWQTKVLDAINRVFREALACESERDVADTCLSVAEYLTGSRFGLIGEKNPEGRFDIISISNPGWDACQMPDSKATWLIENMEIRGIDRSTIREGKSRIVNDPTVHPDRVGTPEGHPPINAFLGVPLRHAGETIGMIGLGNKASGYDLADQKAIEDLSVAFVEVLMRKRAEKGLQASEERFRTVADFTYDWEDWIGPNGKYLYVSPSVERITGYGPDEFFQDPGFLKTLIHPDDQKKMERHWLDHAKTHEVKGLDFRIINRDGDTRWIFHLCQAVYSSTGEWLGRRASNRDITEQKTVEKQLRQAQKMESVGRLAGGVAHDFNNMLSVILGYAELALHKAEKAHPLHADLKEIIKAATRSSDIVQKLLAFAREQIIEPMVLDLNETVESMLKMLRRLIGEDIDLTWLPEADLWPVMMDPTQVEQILANLCVNARDAIAGVGKVTIETQNAVFDEVYGADHAGYRPGEYAMIAISDNGCGMDEEDLDKIFEPFFTTKAVGQGTGLGLATVYGIVKQNDGFINVYSERGRGTTFKIYFARQADKVVATRKECEKELPLSHGETVLVVEDDASLLKLAGGIMDRLGYTVLAAGTPGEAMRLVEEYTEEIHLLVTDVIMPEMSGKDLAEKIREIRPAMKNLFMSGYTANVIACRGMLDEGVQFIQKPFSLKDIAIKVRIALEKSE